MNIRAFFERNRIAFQYVYGIVLIIVIPVLIAFNSNRIISRYTESIDAMIQRQGLSLGRTVYSLIQPDLANEGALRQKITAVALANSQIAELALLVPAEDSYQVIASSDADNVGKLYRSHYYNLAWALPDNDGLATDVAADDGRYWLVALPVSDSAGTKQAVLTIQLSSEIIDTLSSENKMASLWMLTGTIIIVVLFLLAAVRFWDYALLYRRIMEVDRMKDDFIAMASHELRTPVTAIKGYSSLMLEGTMGVISEEVKRVVKIINASADGLGDLVEDLLNVSRIEQGRIDIRREELHPEGIFKEVVDTLAVQAEEKGLELQYSPFQEQLPAIYVDPARLKQIMVNLIGNAIKYTLQGSVQVIVNKVEGGKMLEIRIKDTGIGMSAAERERLFEKFYRIKNEKVKKIRGTGLGLWITKQLVELMNGKIRVDSIEKVGSQFTVLFPITQK